MSPQNLQIFIGRMILEYDEKVLQVFDFVRDVVDDAGQGEQVVAVQRRDEGILYVVDEAASDLVSILFTVLDLFRQLIVAGIDIF